MENRFNFRAYIKKLNKVYNVYRLDYNTDKLRIECGYDAGEEMLINDIKNGSINKFFDEEEFVLMQSTGLKDKNKKEMFENDIALISNTDEKGNIIKSFKVISYSVDSGMFIYKNMEDGSYFANLGEISLDRVEIIGNIYENLGIIGKNEKLIFKDKEQQEIDSIGDIDYQKDKPMPISY